MFWLELFWFSTASVFCDNYILQWKLQKIIIIFSEINNEKVMQQLNKPLPMLYWEIETLLFPFYYMLIFF